MRKEKEYITLEQEQEEQEVKRKKRNKRIRNILIIVALIVLLLLLLKSCTPRLVIPEVIEEVVDKVWDIGQKDKGEVETETPEERQQRLNKDAMRGMLTIDLNVTPIFKDGYSEGNFQFLNDINNFYLMQVEVYRDDTNELIYQSGLIEQGNIIESAKLDVPVSKGVYDCTAYFIAIDTETFAKKGTVGAKMKITIQN